MVMAMAMAMLMLMLGLNEELPRRRAEARNWAGSATANPPITWLNSLWLNVSSWAVLFLATLELCLI